MIYRHSLKAFFSNTSFLRPCVKGQLKPRSPWYAGLLRVFLFPLALLAAIAFAPWCAAQNGWWSIPYPEQFDATRLSKSQPFIRVEGRQFKTDAGNTFVFRGVNIADPDKLIASGRWSKEVFQAVKSYGANSVRIPVHPIAWRGRGDYEYFRLLDQAVVWANELDMYIILDWHSIGNLMTGLFQHPMYATSKQETLQFWRQTAFRYQGISTIAVYEIFNEPTTYNGQLGEASWQEWRAFNEKAIKIIYAHDKNVIPLVAGFNWAYDLSPVRRSPLKLPGVAYAAHPYPQKARSDWFKNWEKAWGFVAKKYPVIATEIGFMREGLPGAHVPVIDDGKYGPKIIEFMEQRGVSWTVWCFDPDWTPNMISDWRFTPTEQGEFFREQMLRLNKK